MKCSFPSDRWAVGEKKLYTKPEELLIRSHKNLHKVYAHLRWLFSSFENYLTTTSNEVLVF